jgi:hypothetical protein
MIEKGHSEGDTYHIYCGRCGLMESAEVPDGRDGLPPSDKEVRAVFEMMGWAAARDFCRCPDCLAKLY